MHVPRPAAIQTNPVINSATTTPHSRPAWARSSQRCPHRYRTLRIHLLTHDRVRSRCPRSAIPTRLPRHFPLPVELLESLDDLDFFCASLRAFNWAWACLTAASA